MQDFKFSKFFGISAPMAVLMGSTRFKELTAGFHGYVGGKMLNSLKIELEIFKHYVVEGLQFVKTVDTNSEDYQNFIRGLQVFLASKENGEMFPSAGETSPISEMKNSDRTDLFGGLAEEIGNGTQANGQGGSEELELPENPFGDLDIPEGDELPDDPFGEDLFGMGLMEVPVAIDLIQMGKECETEPKCSVPLNTHSKVILFFCRLQDNAESLGLNDKEVTAIQEQYGELPAIYTGRVQIKETGETLDLEKKGDPLYHVLKTLQQKAMAMEDGVQLIDHLIAIAQGSVEASSSQTRKFLGQNFNALRNARGCTIETRMMDTLIAESKEAKLNRINAYIQDCRELLGPPKATLDTDLISVLGLKSTDIQEACNKLIEYPELPELQDEAAKPKLVVFVKLCQDLGQFKSVFSSLMGMRQLFKLYCEVTSWTNDKWITALDMMVTDDPEKAGTKISTKFRELYMVAPNFDIDNYCEELLMKYNVIGVTTRGMLFFSDSLKIIGKISGGERYSLSDGCVANKRTFVSAMLQLISMQKRAINPAPSFFADAG